MTDYWAWVVAVSAAFVVFVGTVILLCLLFMNWALRRMDKLTERHLQELDHKHNPDGPWQDINLSNGEEQP